MIGLLELHGNRKTGGTGGNNWQNKIKQLGYTHE